MESLRRHLHETLRALQESGAEVWILRQVPKPGWNVPRGLAAAARWGFRDPKSMTLALSEHEAEFRRQDPLFSGLTEEFPKVRVIDPTPCFLDEAKKACLTSRDGRSWYSDDDHLSVTGAMQLRSVLEPLFGER